MTIRFVLNGAVHEVAGAPPSTTMLDYLRGHLRLTGTKEGCAEGDCGACTIVRVRGGGGARTRYEALNGCLLQIGQMDGAEILSVEGLRAVNGGKLVPMQEAMAAGGGTQCGFCTPGFVCALFALQQSEEEITDEVIHDALAGNLCRCTGYRPIVDAARAAGRRAIAYAPGPPPARSPAHAAGGQTFHAPDTLDALLSLRVRYPGAMLLAGGTDLGLLVAKDRQRPRTVLHTAHTRELRAVAEREDDLIFGAAVTYTEALPFLDRLHPSFARLIRRIGSRQIRNLGTLGGNVGNASPIGDTLPCLIALGATLRLSSPAGEREIPVEDFFLGYRKSALRPDEVIRSITIPKLAAGQAFRAYKVSKRYDQDISAVIAAFRVTLDGEAVTEARIAYGGMAATPKRARAAEEALAAAGWSEAGAARAGRALLQDYTPIGDHRASATYRMRVASNLCLRLWRDLAATEPALDVMAL